MDPRKVKTLQDARKIVQSRGLSHVKVGVFDTDAEYTLRNRQTGEDVALGAPRGTR